MGPDFNLERLYFSLWGAQGLIKRMSLYTNIGNHVHKIEFLKIRECQVKVVDGVT